MSTGNSEVGKTTSDSSEEEVLYVDLDDHCDERDVVYSDDPNTVGNRVLLNARNYLSPTKCFQNGIAESFVPLCNPLPTSVEMVYWHVVLKVHGRNELAQQLLDNNSLRRNPSRIDSWINEQNLVLHPCWFRQADDCYFDIFMYLLNSNSLFGKVFINYITSRPSPANVTFELALTRRKDMVMSTGFRSAQLHKFGQDRQYPGLNSYGEVLNDVARAYLKKDFGYRVGDPSVWFTNIPNSPGQYKYTVLLLSDSQGKYIEIHQGHILPKGGATMEILVEKLEERNINLADFMYIIVQCGINDCQKTVDIQERGWKRMKQILLKAASDRKQFEDYPTVLVSLPFQVPGLVHDISGYVSWVLSEAADTNGVIFCDWKIDNPFLDCNKRRIPHLFEDNVHLSHAGLGLLWKQWAKHLEGLRYVNYHLNSMAYIQAIELPEPYLPTVVAAGVSGNDS